ncbi:tyrosine-type recombinase/integrase [Elusimicrobiota bacterium]
MGKNMIVRRGTALQSVLTKELPKYLSAEEVHSVVERARSARDRLLLEVLWQTGVRVSELLALTPASIDFHASVLRAPTLKRRRPMTRIIPLKPGLLGELARHIAGNKVGERERIFGITRGRVFQIVRAACGAAGIEKSRSHPHVFRHAFAIHAVLGGVPVPVLNSWLGHAGLEATLLYSKVLAMDSRQFHDRLAF